MTRCCSAQPAPALWDHALGKVPTHFVLRLLLAASLFPFKVQLAFAALSQSLCQEVTAFSSFKTHQLKDLTLLKECLLYCFFSSKPTRSGLENKKYSEQSPELRAVLKSVKQVLYVR